MISTAAANASAALSLLEWRGIQASRLGIAGGAELAIGSFAWPLAALHHAWHGAIARCMERTTN